ncbi:MAG: serine/threonine-protein kinase [Clostridia bacterium]|nr:serine/threonine-protein kinase [Clostridia bacterium]
MDNIVKYKLSQYSNIKNLNSDGTAVLSYDLGNDRVCVKKFVDGGLGEIYIKLKSIRCEYLPKIYDIIEYDSSCLIVEEYIKGRSIEEIVAEKGQIDEVTACKYFVDIAEVLEAVHKEGIIHRDISPDNVIVDENNRARLLDFGIARVGNKKKNFDTAILGTAGFASPEQFGFAQTDIRSDIYSMGVLLNYMLTGHIVQMGVYYTEPLKSIIIKSTDIQPNLRYNSIYELKKAVGNLYSDNRLKNSYKRLDNKNIDLGFKPIPGFRTGNIYKKIAAVFFYFFFIVWIFAMLKEYGFSLDGLIYDCSYVLVYLIPIWWFGNNGKQWDIIPGLKNRSLKAKRIAAIIIYFMVLSAFCLLVPMPQ